MAATKRLPGGFHLTSDGRAFIITAPFPHGVPVVSPGDLACNNKFCLRDGGLWVAGAGDYPDEQCDAGRCCPEPGTHLRAGSIS